MTKKSALGKGLSALLSNAETDITSKEYKATVGSVSEIEISKIEANPFQPRTDFDEIALKELSESIKAQGIIQPITVRKLGYDKFQIISGERRFRASQMAGLKAIPAYIRIANDQSMLEMALVENIQRENLNAMEVAISYKRLIDECNISNEELADRVSKDRSTVINYLRLLKLPPQIQAAIRDEKISMGHARAIINIDNADEQLALFNEIIKGGLSVRKVEEMARNAKANKKQGTLFKNQLTPDLRKVQDKLGSLYETKVDLSANAKGQGKIVFTFYNNEDLNRLLEMLDFE